MKIIKLTLVCLLASGLCCCNNKNNQDGNKINTQETTCVDSVNIDTGRKNNFDNEFTRVYTMKKKDSTIIGDVYVKFEKDTHFHYLDSLLFRQLYITNKNDTLYSIKNDVFFNENEIVDVKYITDTIYGYTLFWIGNDKFYIARWDTNGECIGNDVIIDWNYDENILKFRAWGSNISSPKVVNSEEINNKFTKVYTMKKQDSTVIGDVYVKFENDSLFRYLYVINDSDTLYSIKRTVFLSENRIDAITSDGVYGYTFLEMSSDNFYIGLWGKDGECGGESITIEWNYDEEIVEIFKF